jgi:chromosome segregation ATPase
MNFAVLPPEAPAATDAIYQLLAVLADRAKTKAALAKVVAARDEAQAAAEKFGDLQIERAALQKRQAEFEAWTAAERRKIREALRQIDASRAEFNVERAVHATKVEALRADREQLERSRSAHESKLAELERTHRALA